MNGRFGRPRPRIPLCMGERETLASEVDLNPNTISGLVNGSRRLGWRAAVRFLGHPKVAGSGLALEHLLGEPLPPGIRVFAFETDEDIERRVEAARKLRDHRDGRTADLGGVP